VEWFNFENTPHILIAGSSGGGKSNHINQMIATFITMSSPSELRLLLIDNKGGIEFTHWEGVKHLLKPMVKHVSQVLPTLKYARVLMERRLTEFEQVKAKNLASYNEKMREPDRIPRIIIIIDEMATLLGLGDLTNDIQSELRVLSSQGRAVGIHLMVCTQHSSVDVLPGWIKTNMSMRIASRMPSHSSSMIILNTVTAATLPDVPGRMVFALGSTEVIAQSPYISDDEIARSVKLSRAFPDPNEAEFIEHQEQPRIVRPPRFSLDDMIELALKEFGGKLTPSGIHRQLGNDIVTLRDLRAMVNGVIEGWEDKGEVVHRGAVYILKKDRNAYVMINPNPTESLIEPPIEPENEEETVELEPLDHVDSSVEEEEAEAA